MIIYVLILGYKVDHLKVIIYHNIFFTFNAFRDYEMYNDIQQIHDYIQYIYNIYVYLYQLHISRLMQAIKQS